MAEVKQDQKQTVTINDKEYIVEDLEPIQQNTLQLLMNTDNKIMALQGEIAILQAGRDTMMKSLVEDLENPKETEEDEIKQLHA